MHQCLYLGCLTALVLVIATDYFQLSETQQQRFLPYPLEVYQCLSAISATVNRAHGSHAEALMLHDVSDI